MRGLGAHFLRAAKSVVAVCNKGAQRDFQKKVCVAPTGERAEGALRGIEANKRRSVSFLSVLLSVPVMGSLAHSSFLERQTDLAGAAEL